MLPEVVWQMPEFGTLNLHASLLPQYRGAAPINHAIINGETETGLTTFFIEKEIDTGNIILTKKLPILPSDDAGTLHDRMKAEGGILVTETLKLIETDNVQAMSQKELYDSGTELKSAPKIFKADCRINWHSSCKKIHNMVRGLSPFPGAYSIMKTSDGSQKQLKIYKTYFEISGSSAPAGTILTDNKKSLSVATDDGLLFIEELQIEGKKRMGTAEFLRGMQFIRKNHME